MGNEPIEAMTSRLRILITSQTFVLYNNESKILTVDPESYRAIYDYDWPCKQSPCSDRSYCTDITPYTYTCTCRDESVFGQCEGLELSYMVAIIVILGIILSLLILVLVCCRHRIAKSSTPKKTKERVSSDSDSQMSCNCS